MLGRLDAVMAPLHRARGEGGCPPIDDETGSRHESAPGIWRWRTAVEHYVGIDVSLELSSVCVVDGRGKIVKEAKVASEPEALVCFFKELGVPMNRIGLEAGPLSQWLHAGLTQAGFQTVLLETRHVKAALSVDGEDGPQGCVWACRSAADGMVPAGARQIDWIAGDAGAAGCAQAASRKVAGCGIEHSGILRGFGLKVGQVTRKTFEAR